MEPLGATLSQFAYGVETAFAGMEEGPLVFSGDGWVLSHINNKRAWDDGHCHGNGCCPSLLTTHLATLGANLETGENSGLLILEAPRRSLIDTSTNCSLLSNPRRAGPAPLIPKNRMEVMPLEEAVIVWCALPSPTLWFYDILLTF